MIGMVEEDVLVLIISFADSRGYYSFTSSVPASPNKNLHAVPLLDGLTSLLIGSAGSIVELTLDLTVVDRFGEAALFYVGVSYQGSFVYLAYTTSFKSFLRFFCKILTNSSGGKSALNIS
jgi:hypothetical protein